ncbi:MAG: HD domain-containing phosphohydrolase [Thermodesulfovibrionales bacterium]
MKIRLSAKILIISLITIAIVLSIGFYCIVKIESDRIRTSIRNNSVYLSRIIKEQMGEIYTDIQEGRAYIQMLTEQLADLEEVLYVEIYDRNANVVAHTRRELVGLEPEDKLNIEYARKIIKSGETMTMKHPGKGRFELFVPVYSNDVKTNGEILGVINLAMRVDHNMDVNKIVVRAKHLVHLFQMAVSKSYSNFEADRVYMQSLTEHLAEVEGVSEIEVYSDDAVIVAHTIEELIGGNPQPGHAHIVEKVLSTGDSIVNEDLANGIIRRFMPIVVRDDDGEKDVSGVVEFEMDMGISEKSIIALRNNMTVTAVLLFLSISGVLLIVLRKVIVEPVKLLSGHTRSIASGDFTRKLKLDSGDELGDLTGSLNEMTMKLKNSRDEIISAKQDWEETFNAITDMITIHDRDYNILHSNRAAEEMLSLPSLASADAKCFQYFHGKDSPPEGCPGSDCLKTGESYTFEIFEPYLGKYLEIRAMPRFDNNKQIIGLIHVTRDITSRKHSEKRIESHMERLRALRTIDNAIAGSLDMRLTLDVFIDQVIMQLGVNAADVLLLNPFTNHLDFAAGKGFMTNRIKNISLKLGDGYAGHVALKREKISIPDISKFISDIDELDDIDMNDHQSRFPDSFLVNQDNFKSYFALPLIAKGKVKGVLEVFHRAPLEPDDEWFEFLESLAGHAAIAIDNAMMFDDLQQSRDELIMAYDTTIEGWSKALDFRDKETEGHSRRVTDLTVKMARILGIREEEIIHVRRGSLLHDIGKMGVPDDILFKPGKLDDEEWEVMRKHPVIAYELLSPIKFLRPAIDIPYCHHEKWDGSGYPRGIRGEQVPLPARIFAVIDVWDALMSDRPYRPAWSEEKTREYIESESGKHFDPEVVQIFLRTEL